LNKRFNQINDEHNSDYVERNYSEQARKLVVKRFAPQNPKAFIRTFGCQGNVADSEIIKGMLISTGFELTQTIDEADFILLNTCAIREHAQDRVFGNIGAVKKFKESKSGLIVALCGCLMQQDHVIEKIRSSYSFVDLIFGTHSIQKLPELLYRCLIGEKHIVDVTISDQAITEGLPVKRDSTFKAWLPVMYGCDNYCSYCVVPYVRGRERSRVPEIILRKANELVSSGYKEITLLGQNVNSYGIKADFDMDFSALVESINAIQGDFLIRFMTSNPKDCTHKLLDTMARCDKVAKHLHLPFQSGNDRILRAMNRGYTREQYLELLTYARYVMPDLSISSDVIVGFPGEQYDEFRDTLSLIETAEFTSLFTFIFSPREGTAAALLPDPVNRDEKVRWFKELTLLQEKIASARTAGMKGQIFRVLCEAETKEGSGVISGRTESNVIIEFPSPPAVIGSFQKVLVDEVLTWMVKGKLL
jgi:tRNA-2-methylthio-N6-dimethylallyladenosine synthase